MVTGVTAVAHAAFDDEIVTESPPAGAAIGAPALRNSIVMSRVSAEVKATEVSTILSAALDVTVAEPDAYPGPCAPTVVLPGPTPFTVALPVVCPAGIVIVGVVGATMLALPLDSVINNPPVGAAGLMM